MDIREEGKPFSATGTTGVGCLVMQGFTGTVGSIRYYAEALAAKGLSVEAPRLTGHGTRWQDVNKVRYTDWIHDADQAYQLLARRCDKVFVTGLSMGGTLILYLAEHHPEIAGVITVNAPVFMTDRRAPFLPIIKYLIASTPAIASDIMEPGIIEPAYDRTPTAGAHEMVKLLGVTRRDLGLIAQPLLVMRSTHDHVVPHECGQFIMDHTVSSDKQMIVFERSAHVVTMDYDKDGVVDSAWKFIERLSH
ncbi:MAG: alpha/beta fold hydrolase [Caldiserica bacterium]|nr:alpha/beta fold hydrolase [Caldisericota bacterium]